MAKLPKDRHTREYESYDLRSDLKVAQKTIDKDVIAALNANTNLQYLLSIGADLSNIITTDQGELIFDFSGSFVTQG